MIQRVTSLPPVQRNNDSFGLAYSDGFASGVQGINVATSLQSVRQQLKREVQGESKRNIRSIKWDENVSNQISHEMKTTKASVEYTLSGEINGQAVVEYLMFYKYFDSNDQHKSSATYLGLIRFIGTVHGKNGSFVIEDHGTFENGAANSILQILDSSGTGELKNIKGTGHYRANQNGTAFELDYTLETK